ncbi:hypothetical protein ACA910_011149 [Epithemia clementina (nom. ined.)]
MKLISAMTLLACASSAAAFSPVSRTTTAVSSPLFRSSPLKVATSEVNSAQTAANGIQQAAQAAMTPFDISKISMIETPAAAYQILADKGKSNANMSKVKTLVSAMIGGAYVGMGGMLSLAISGNMGGVAVNNPGLAKLMFATLFPVNLLLALQAGGQLFTGNTAYMTAAVCERKTTVQKLVRSWAISFVGNLIAGIFFAYLCRYAGVLSGGAAELAKQTLINKTSIAFGPIVVRAMLCNWLVCLAVYLSMQAKDLTGKYFGILLPISTFVAIGFEHSVANMFLLPAGLLCQGPGGSVSIMDAITKNLLPVAIGNAISGSLMVGALFSYMFGRLGEEKK